MGWWLRAQAVPGGTNPAASTSPARGESLKQEEPQGFCCAPGLSSGCWDVLWMRLCKAQSGLGLRMLKTCLSALKTPTAP